MISLLSQFLKDFKNQDIHRKIYIIGLFIMVVGLPLSSFLTSSAQFLLALNWIIERDFKSKIKRLNSNKIIYFFLLLPLVHTLWLLNTTNFTWALHDLKIKLPLLIIPIILGTSKTLSGKELKWVLSAFVFAVFAGTVVSVAVFADIYHIDVHGVRGISIFISHIRFGLMIVLSIIIVGYYLVMLFSKLSVYNITGLILLIVWFLLFLIILQSITGWVTLFIVLLYLFTISYKNIKNRKLQVGTLIALTFIITSTFIVIAKVYHDFYFTKTVNLAELPSTTSYGNKYLNDTTSQLKENGHYIKILISYKELSQTWPELSNIPFKGLADNGFSIKSTMVRYLASKGLTKDRDGLLSLDSKDIKMIEDGYASCVFRSNFIPYTKIYSILWEIDRYIKTGNANNKSIVQRIEFNRAAFHIIKNNFWFGVGTGDLKIAYHKAYSDIKSKLKEKNRYRAHNQFVTFFVAFGLFGFLISMLSMFYPGLVNLHKGGILLSSFMIIIFISMINEDTLETQAGVTFYALFYTIFTMSKSNNND